MRSLFQRIARRTLDLSRFGASTGSHFTRYTMYPRIKSVVESHISKDGGADKKVLAIGASVPLAAEIGLEKAEVVPANYPEFDILCLPMEDDSFDVVISDQVLEHVEGNPFRAVSESVRVVRPGGYIIHTTCFLNAIHCAPQDFWRFTPYSLELLCRDVADPVEIGSAGGLASILIVAMNLRFVPVPNLKFHPLHRLAVRDNPLWPVTTWVVAQKPIAECRLEDPI